MWARRPRRRRSARVGPMSASSSTTFCSVEVIDYTRRRGRLVSRKAGDAEPPWDLRALAGELTAPNGPPAVSRARRVVRWAEVRERIEQVGVGSDSV